MATKAQISKVTGYVAAQLAHTRLLKRLDRLQMQVQTSAEYLQSLTEGLKTAGITDGFETSTHIVNVQRKKVRRVIPSKLKAFKEDDDNFKTAVTIKVSVAKL